MILLDLYKSLVPNTRRTLFEAMTTYIDNEPKYHQIIANQHSEVYACFPTLKLNLSDLIFIFNKTARYISIFSFLLGRLKLFLAWITTVVIMFPDGTQCLNRRSMTTMIALKPTLWLISCQCHFKYLKSFRQLTVSYKPMRFPNFLRFGFRLHI